MLVFKLVFLTDGQTDRQHQPQSHFATEKEVCGLFESNVAWQFQVRIQGHKVKLFGNEWAMLWQGLLQITIIKFKIINKYKPQQPAKECNTTVCIGCLIVKQDKRPAAASGYVKFEGIMPVAGNNYKLDKEFHHRQTQAELNSQHFHQICIL